MSDHCQSSPGANTQSIADYLAQLLKDRKQVTAFPNVFIHVERLIDEGKSLRLFLARRLPLRYFRVDPPVVAIRGDLGPGANPPERGTEVHPPVAHLGSVGTALLFRAVKGPSAGRVTSGYHEVSLTVRGPTHPHTVGRYQRLELSSPPHYKYLSACHI